MLRPKQPRHSHKELLEKVAARTYLPKQTVRMIYETILTVVREELVKGNRVLLSNFGVLRPVLYRSPINGAPCPTVRMKMSPIMKNAAREIDPARFQEHSREITMDKFGVQTDASKQKLAGIDKTCPSCGSELVQNTNVPQCPSCGTEPFEDDEEED